MGVSVSSGFGARRRARGGVELRGRLVEWEGGGEGERRRGGEEGERRRRGGEGERRRGGGESESRRFVPLYRLEELSAAYEFDRSRVRYDSE